MKLNRLIPMLPVRSMPVSVEFYQNMLGFKVERRNDDWGWAMLCFDECRLMVDQSINAHPEAPANSFFICTLITLWSITSKFGRTAWLRRSWRSPSTVLRSSG